MVGVSILIKRYLDISYSISKDDATVLTSLSPLPEQLITISVSLSKVGHNFSNLLILMNGLILKMKILLLLMLERIQNSKLHVFQGNFYIYQ